ncbi:hypothetical protein SCB49_11709 [unidentified eubacterium SCB49]|nr:hypothetical protein SCB49_11709 [unidentified eubacterium SCB49]
MKVALRPFGEHAILIDWPAVNNKDVQREIIAVSAAIQEDLPHLVMETVTTYHSIAVYLNKTVSLQDGLAKLNGLVKASALKTEQNQRVVTVPVCYEGSFALDLEKVATKNQLTTESVISLHTENLYLVNFIGFLPGFPYLTGLDKKLDTPRLETPRQQIPAGSVGIGGAQTGIYPSNSPGGWNIIGKTPLALFDVNQNPPNLLKAGDYIKFESISLQEFRNIAHEVSTGAFHLKTSSL